MSFTSEYLSPCAGSGGTFYQWSRGVQIRANLDLLMDWAHGAELGELALGCLNKLSTAVNLLATPKEHLLQVSLFSICSSPLFTPLDSLLSLFLLSSFFWLSSSLTFRSISASHAVPKPGFQSGLLRR